MAFKPISIAQPANSLRSSNALSEAVTAAGQTFSELGNKYQGFRDADNLSNFKQEFQGLTPEEVDAKLANGTDYQDKFNLRDSVYNTAANALPEEAVTYQSRQRTIAKDSFQRQVDAVKGNHGATMDLYNSTGPEPTDNEAVRKFRADVKEDFLAEEIEKVTPVHLAGFADEQRRENFKVRSADLAELQNDPQNADSPYFQAASVNEEDNLLTYDADYLAGLEETNPEEASYAKAILQKKNEEMVLSSPETYTEDNMRRVMFEGLNGKDPYTYEGQTLIEKFNMSPAEQRDFVEDGVKQFKNLTTLGTENTKYVNDEVAKATKAYGITTNREETLLNFLNFAEPTDVPLTPEAQSEAIVQLANVVKKSEDGSEDVLALMQGLIGGTVDINQLDLSDEKKGLLSEILAGGQGFEIHELARAVGVTSQEFKSGWLNDRESNIDAGDFIEALADIKISGGSNIDTLVERNELAKSIQARRDGETEATRMTREKYIDLAFKRAGVNKLNPYSSLNTKNRRLVDTNMPIKREDTIEAYRAARAAENDNDGVETPEEKAERLAAEEAARLAAEKAAGGKLKSAIDSLAFDSSEDDITKAVGKGSAELLKSLDTSVTDYFASVNTTPESLNKLIEQENIKGTAGRFGNSIEKIAKKLLRNTPSGNISDNAGALKGTKDMIRKHIAKRQSAFTEQTNNINKLRGQRRETVNVQKSAREVGAVNEAFNPTPLAIKPTNAIDTAAQTFKVQTSTDTSLEDGANLYEKVYHTVKGSPANQKALRVNMAVVDRGEMDNQNVITSAAVLAAEAFDIDPKQLVYTAMNEASGQIGKVDHGNANTFGAFGLQGDTIMSLIKQDNGGKIFGAKSLSILKAANISIDAIQRMSLSQMNDFFSDNLDVAALFAAAVYGTRI